MNELDSVSTRLEHRKLGRRNLFRGAVGAVAGVGLFRPQPAFADNNNPDRNDHLGCALVNPIPGVSSRLNPLESRYTITR